MATQPLSGPASPGPDDDATLVALVALRRERDELEARAVEAETVAERLADELLEARRQLAESADADHLTLFDTAAPVAAASPLASDGSDPRLPALALAAVALVAALVTLLSLVNSGISVFTVVMVATTAALTWGAWQLRVVPAEVHVEDGVVRIESGGQTYRFDLRQEATRVEMDGQPGDPHWQVRFLRRYLDPCTVDAAMVDPHAFVRELRAFRQVP